MGGSCPKLHCRLLSTFPSFPPPGQSLPFPDQQRTTPHPTLGGASRPRHPAPWAPALARGTEHGKSPIGRAPKSRNCFKISGKWFCLCEGGNWILSPADCPATNPCSPLAASEFELLGEKSEAHDGLPGSALTGWLCFGPSRSPSEHSALEVQPFFHPGCDSQKQALVLPLVGCAGPSVPHSSLII